LLLLNVILVSSAYCDVVATGGAVTIVGTDMGGIGIAVPDSLHDYRVKLLKEMGVNANWAATARPLR